MSANESLETALGWYQTGVEKIQAHSVSIGLSYLEKAIPVFLDHEDGHHSSLARHYRLLAFKMAERFEEVEREFAPVMDGYTKQGNHYGKALLIVHLAEALAAQGRWERANSYFNLAAVLAENNQFALLLAYIFQQQAALCWERDNHLHALRHFRRAEHFIQTTGDNLALANLKLARGEVLSSMGEGSEAASHLEEAQTLFLRVGRPQEAMKPLNLLKQIYESGGMIEEKERVSSLIHRCGQLMLKRDTFPIPREDLGPPIEPPEKAD